MINPAMASALNGLQWNYRSFQYHTDRISRVGTTSDADLRPEDIAGLMTAERGYRANLAVVCRTNNMLGILLDVLA